MFREKIAKNDHICKKKINILNIKESPTNEWTNQKTNIYQIKKSPYQEIVIENKKTLSSYVPSFISFGKRKFDFKNDILIKEIIGAEDNNKFKTEFKLSDINNIDNNLFGNIKNSPFNCNDSLIQNKSLKINYSYEKPKSLEENGKENINKIYKRENSLNIDRAKFIDNNFNYINYYTPKNYMKNKNKTNYFNDSKSSTKSNNIKINNKYNKNSSNLNKQNLKEIKKKKLEKIIQIMKNNNNSSLNVNLLRQERKENFLSILSNISNKKNKFSSFPNTLNFNDIINSSNQRHKKKLTLKLNEYKKEKTDSYENIESYEHNISNSINNRKIKMKIKNGKFSCKARNNFYRKSLNSFIDLNISTDYTSNEKKNTPKSTSKKKVKDITFDSSNAILNRNKERKRFFSNKNKVNNIHEFEEKLNQKNYKILLNDVKKRMSFLIKNLFNYIELLKKNK